MTALPVPDRLEPLPPLGRFVADLLALEPVDGSMQMTAITVAMPVELDLLSGGGRVLALGAAPPTQAIETSVLPVFHQLRVTLVADGFDADAGGDDMAEADDGQR